MLAVLATALICSPVIAQEKRTTEKIEKHIEVENENGVEKVTITTKTGDMKNVQVMEGEEARAWIKDHNDERAVSSEMSKGSGTRVFVTEEEDNGRRMKKVMVISSDGNTEDIIIHENSGSGGTNSYRYETKDGEDPHVWVDGKEALTFKPDPTNGTYLLTLDIDENQKGSLYVKDPKGNFILEETISTKGPIERNVKVDSGHSGEYTVGFKSDGIVIVKKQFIK